MAAQFVSFGKVLVPVVGMPVRLPIPPTLNPHSVHAIVIAALQANVGAVYIGQAGSMNRATLANVLQVLPIPTANSIPTFSIAVTQAANAISLDTFWFDADQANDGVLVTALIA